MEENRHFINSFIDPPLKGNIKLLLLYLPERHFLFYKFGGLSDEKFSKRI
jgi:hypothetical protein